MFHLECSNDRRRIILPVVILKPEPVTDLDGYKAMALLDTGATTTGITPRVIDALGLLSFGKRPLGSAQGDGQADRYLFRIGLHATAAAGEGTSAFPYVFDATMGFGLNESFRLDALLGMDVLSQCDFRMDRTGHAILSFG
jgi:hypothetical protein